MPCRRANVCGRSYTMRVLEGDEVLFSTSLKTGFYYFSVYFHEDGTVSACKWIDDDICQDFAPLE
ncbi:MAG: hypothetical protein JRI23_22280 [Deltaproteobacteria bacterium]|jgi:hypothetical protein|nr:hypothetical protein [Deltaproteobacteria bacterium]MBW2534674.1 hypothetical protein [Deltaproteobacteria bacterium]